MEWLSRASLLMATLLLAGTLFPGGQALDLLAEPPYRLGDRWEYDVQGELEGLAGLEELGGRLAVQGRASSRVTAVSPDAVNITWSGHLDLRGSVVFPTEQGDAVLQAEGTLRLDRTEHREPGVYLPVAHTTTLDIDLAVAVGGLSTNVRIQGTTQAAVLPGSTLPTYPLEPGEDRVEVVLRTESHMRLSFPGQTLEQEGVEDLPTRMWLNRTAALPVAVPAGAFDALRVALTLEAGLPFGAFHPLFPGAVEVTDHAPDMAQPVQVRYLAGGQEVGNLTLLSFAPASALPAWLLPVLVGGLLALPVLLLGYRAIRERRRGL